MSSNNVRDALIAKLRASATGQPTEEIPVEVVVPATNYKSTDPNYKEYADIIGEAHPSGKQFYFSKGKTWFDSSDWKPEHAQDIPSVNPHHVFDHTYALALLMSMEHDKPIMAYGPPGCGKSVTPEQVCARVNRPFLFVSGMGGAEPADYIGSPWVTNGSMEWKDGKASYAVRNGYFMLYDEPFKVAAQNNMWCQSLLDDRRVLQLQGHPDPVHGTLKAHERFRIALADNVQGLGDGMDRYAADIQDQSLLSRCTYNVQVDYISQAEEIKILSGMYPTIASDVVGKVVALAALLRNAWKKGTVKKPYSVRDTQTFCGAIQFLGSVSMAFNYTYFQAVQDKAERQAIVEMYNNLVCMPDKIKD